MEENKCQPLDLNQILVDFGWYISLLCDCWWSYCAVLLWLVCKLDADRGLHVSVSPEAQRGHHDQREDHANLWDGLWAGEEVVGRPVPVLHGGERDARPQPARRRKETSGPLQTLPGCPRDRRPGHGETPVRE